MLNAIWGVLLELAPWLLLGAAIAGALHVLLPENFIHRHLQGRWGVLKAVGLGVPLPLCSCGVIPAGLGLKRDGASNGASVGFLISTPQTGVDSILVSASFLGWPFALFKVISAAVTGIAGGLLADRVAPSEPIVLTPETPTADSAKPSGVRPMVTHAVEILRTIWAWLVFGILVSAAITVFVPKSALVGLAAYGGILAALVVLAISTPLYVCATASVPIAAALVNAGLPTGAALVFLMAGPATNVATIGAIYRGFGARTLAVYLGTIIIGSIGFGLGFDFLLGATATHAVAHDGHHSWWAVASAIVLLALLTWFAVDDAKTWWRRRSAGTAQSATIVISVDGMTCGGCVKRLESALLKADGVESAVVTLEPGSAAVSGSIDEQALRELIIATGYRVT